MRTLSNNRRRAGDFHKRTENLMGTFVSVGVAGCAADKASALFRCVFAEMRRIASLLNHFDPDSEIGQLNAAGSLSGASRDTLAVMRRALCYSELSGGAFDISAMPLVRLWKRGADGGAPPTRSEIAAASKLADCRNILIEGDSVRFLRPGMKVTLAGIAKGYIVDKAIAALRSCGAVRAMVNGGGDVRVIGDPDSPPWRIGIRDPFRRKSTLCVLKAHNLAVASSGSYSHAYNDIIDPRTGEQAREVIGVSVAVEEAVGADALATSGAEETAAADALATSVAEETAVADALTTSVADALATSVAVLGVDAGTEFVEKQRGGNAAALIVSSEGVRRKTAGWARYCAAPHAESHGEPR